MWQFEIVNDQTEFSKVWERQSGHLLQSWAWGEIKRPHWKPIRIIATSENPREQVTFSILSRVVTPLKIKMGYIARASFDNESLSSDLLNYIKTQKLVDILIIEASNTESELSSAVSQLPIYTTHIQPDHSNLIELAKGEEAIWQGMRGNYRRSINNATSSGIQITSHTNQSEQVVSEFYSIMKTIFVRTGYVMHSQEYFEKVWNYLAAANQAEILLAWYEKDLVGAYFMAFDSICTYELYGGVNSTGRDLEAGFSLKWAAIKSAIARGSKYYDHWGVAPADSEGNYIKNHPLSNISKFKSRFGGNDIAYATTRYLSINKPKAILVNLAQRIHSALISLRSKK